MRQKKKNYYFCSTIKSEIDHLLYCGTEVDWGGVVFFFLVQQMVGILFSFSGFCLFNKNSVIGARRVTVFGVFFRKKKSSHCNWSLWQTQIIMSILIPKIWPLPTTPPTVLDIFQIFSTCIMGVEDEEFNISS